MTSPPSWGSLAAGAWRRQAATGLHSTQVTFKWKTEPGEAQPGPKARQPADWGRREGQERRVSLTVPQTGSNGTWGGEGSEPPQPDPDWAATMPWPQGDPGQSRGV